MMEKGRGRIDTWEPPLMYYSPYHFDRFTIKYYRFLISSLIWLQRWGFGFGEINDFLTDVCSLSFAPRNWSLRLLSKPSASLLGLFTVALACWVGRELGGGSGLLWEKWHCFQNRTFSEVLFRGLDNHYALAEERWNRIRNTQHRPELLEGEVGDYTSGHLCHLIQVSPSPNSRQCAIFFKVQLTFPRSCFWTGS